MSWYDVKIENYSWRYYSEGNSKEEARENFRKNHPEFNGRRIYLTKVNYSTGISKYD